jgi:hypothetical protein
MTEVLGSYYKLIHMAHIAVCSFGGLSLQVALTVNNTVTFDGSRNSVNKRYELNPLTPELNPSTQRCLTRFFTGDFAS